MSTTTCEVCLKLIAAYDAAVKAYTEAKPDRFGEAQQGREELRKACQLAKYKLRNHALSDRLVSRSRKGLNTHRDRPL